MIKANVGRAVRRHALASLSAGEMDSGLPAGVRALDIWRSERFGSVLFFAEADAGLYSFNQPSLHHEDARLRQLRGWVSTGGGGIGVEDLSELATSAKLGLLDLGGGSDNNIRLKIGFAPAEVAEIRLSNGARTWTHPVGIDGFFLVGATSQQPPCRAIGVGRDGREIDGPPLLL